MSWSERWRAVLDDADAGMRRRRRRGREYARSGRVAALQVTAGQLTGKVQGTRTTPHSVVIRVPVLSDAQWQEVVAVLLSQARHSARLLAGHAPDGLEDEVTTGGVQLFPDRRVTSMECTCDDPRSPCSHTAAVWEAVAANLDDDPFLLFRLRGRGPQRLLGDVHVARRPPVPDSRDRTPTGSLSVTEWSTARLPLADIRLPKARPPTTPAAALRVAGDPPAWPGGVSACDLLRPHLEQAAAWAGALDDGES